MNEPKESTLLALADLASNVDEITRDMVLGVMPEDGEVLFQQLMETVDKMAHICIVQAHEVAIESLRAQLKGRENRS